MSGGDLVVYYAGCFSWGIVIAHLITDWFARLHDPR